MARNFAKILQTPGYVTKISADVNKFEFGAELGLIWIYKTELGLFSGECTLLHALRESKKWNLVKIQRSENVKIIIAF